MKREDPWAAAAAHAAAHCGLPARPSEASPFNPVERHLFLNGFPGLARSIHAARGMAADTGLPDWLHRLQTQLNLPFLVSAAALLLGHLRAAGVPRAVFASPSSHQLRKLFDTLRNASGLAAPASEVWHTSRLARAAAQPAYLTYSRQLLANRPMLVSLCGRGESLAAFFARLGLGDETPGVFFCEFIADATPQTVPPRSRTDEDAAALRVTSLLSTRSFVGAEVLEMLNAPPEGLLRGVTETAGGWIEQRDPPAFDGPEGALWRAQSAFIDDFAIRLGSTLVLAVFDEIGSQAPQLISALHDAVALLQPEIATLSATLQPAHRRREHAVAEALRRIAG